MILTGGFLVCMSKVAKIYLFTYFIFRKFHGSDKDACFEDLKKGKLEIVITTFETYRDKVVSFSLNLKFVY